MQLSLSTLFSLYIRDATSGEDVFDAGWIGRQGIALALQSAADVLTAKDLPAVMTFLISRALVFLLALSDKCFSNEKNYPTLSHVGKELGFAVLSPRNPPIMLFSEIIASF